MVLCQRATSMDYRKKSEEWVYVLLSLSDMHRYSLLVDVLGLYLTCEIESWFYLLTIFLISIFTGTFAHCRFIWGYWKWSGRFLVQRQTKRNNFTCRKSGYKLTPVTPKPLVIFLTIHFTFLMNHNSVESLLLDRSPINIQNSSNPSSQKNLVVWLYDRTRCYF